MAFSVLVSAAQAAGFYDAALLSRNAREDKEGQAVAQMPDCKDLILAPDYPLESRLLALEEAERAQGYAFPSRTKRPPLVRPGASRRSEAMPTDQTHLLREAQTFEHGMAASKPGALHLPTQQPDQSYAPNAPTLPNLPARNPHERKLTGLHQQALETYQPGMGYRVLADQLGCGKDKAGDLMKDLRKWGYLPPEL
jgi:hypothetical protein